MVSRTHCSHRCCLLVAWIELGSDDGETNKGSKMNSANNSLCTHLLGLSASLYRHGTGTKGGEPKMLSVTNRTS